MGLKKKKWFQTLMTIAPKVASALGGPVGGLAVNVIKEALGMPDATEAELQAQIAASSPDTLLALRKAEQSFELEMKKLEISEEQLVYTDRDSARDREKAVKDKMPAVLAVLAWMQWAFIVVIMFFANDLSILETPEKREVLMFVLATTQAIVIGAFAYYHGSSSGSKTKTDAFSTWMEHQGKRDG